MIFHLADFLVRVEGWLMLLAATVECVAVIIAYHLFPWWADDIVLWYEKRARRITEDLTDKARDYEKRSLL